MLVTEALVCLGIELKESLFTHGTLCLRSDAPDFFPQEVAPSAVLKRDSILIVMVASITSLMQYLQSAYWSAALAVTIDPSPTRFPVRWNMEWHVGESLG